MSKRGNGEGCVTHRADGRWAGVISVPGPAGSRRRKTFYGKTRAEVSAKMTKGLGDLQVGIEPLDERTTVKRFLTSWLEDTVKPNRRESTYNGYESNVRLHLVPAIGNLALARLTPAHVRRMMEAQLKSGLSPRSVQYIRAVLRVALKQAEADGIVHRNAAALAPGPTVRRTEIRPLTPQQVKLFLAGVGTDRLSALYVVAFTTGLRQSEILGLRWEDVDLDAGTLRVAQTLQRGAGVRYGSPKSDRSRRTLMLAGFISEALKGHRTRQLEERFRADSEWQDYGLVFTTRFGTPVDHRNIGRYFHAHLKRLGLPAQRFHDARHACATFLLSQGVELRVIQEILGHSQIGITANLYSHVMPALQRAAMVHIDKAFSEL